MGIGNVLAKSKYTNVNTVLGIDASTNSLAFCLYDEYGPVKWGEISFKGSSVFERLAYAQNVNRIIKSELQADLICFESAVYIQNKRTVILLAYSFGSIISSLMSKGTQIEDISPLVWQKEIGNNPFTKAEKEAIYKEFPNKSKSWYSNKIRDIRKERTIGWCKEMFNIDVESDNVSDAIAIAHVAYNKFGSDDGES